MQAIPVCITVHGTRIELMCQWYWYNCVAPSSACSSSSLIRACARSAMRRRLRLGERTQAWTVGGTGLGAEFIETSDLRTVLHVKQWIAPFTSKMGIRS
jgi:hypothetical protein